MPCHSTRTLSTWYILLLVMANHQRQTKVQFHQSPTWGDRWVQWTRVQSMDEVTLTRVGDLPNSFITARSHPTMMTASQELCHRVPPLINRFLLYSSISQDPLHLGEGIIAGIPGEGLLIFSMSVISFIAVTIAIDLVPLSCSALVAMATRKSKMASCYDHRKRFHTTTSLSLKDMCLANAIKVRDLSYVLRTLSSAPSCSEFIWMNRSPSISLEL